MPRPSGLRPGGRAGMGSFAQIASLEGADRTACLLGDRHGAAHRDVDQNDGLRRRHHELVVGKADGDALVGRAGAADAADADETLDQVVEAGRRVVLDASKRASRTPRRRRRELPRWRWYSVRAWSKYGR